MDWDKFNDIRRKMQSIGALRYLQNQIPTKGEDKAVEVETEKKKCS